ncbi:MAG TPA: DUF4145 domain-containing protein [Pyrinomonadaceae bacterium]|jgi:hypothetical protein|nr:DUF4145 domain-containing protein [Pyrinomonadaceae bacterium]
MSNREKKFSGVLECGHCGNTAPMEYVAEYSQTKEYSHEESHLSWEAGAIYELLLCPACNGVILRRYYYHELRDPEEWVPIVLYPQPDKLPLGLPDKIKVAYQGAAKVKGIDTNAYAVLLGRILELVCEDRRAVGNSLFQKLENLGRKGEIPRPLVEMAHNLRALRNIGAHASLGELSADEVPVLDDLSRAILEYVYSAPQLIERVKTRLNEIKGSQKLESGE